MIHQLAVASNDVVEAMLEVLNNRYRPHSYVEMLIAIRVLHEIGYPRNEAAIPALLYHIGDFNLLGWGEAIKTLRDMDPDVVIPHLIRAFLDKGKPYHQKSVAGDNRTTWAVDVEGLCTMLYSKVTLPDAYAYRCCPALNQILCQSVYAETDEEVPDIESILNAVEQAGTQVPYIIPTLLAVAKKYPNVKQQALELVARFPQEVRDDYKFMLI